MKTPQNIQTQKHGTYTAINRRTFALSEFGAGSHIRSLRAWKGAGK